MLEMDNPNIWNVNVRGNLDVEMEKNYEKFILSVSENTNLNVDEMNVFRFYSLIEHIKEKNRGNGNN